AQQRGARGQTKPGGDVTKISSVDRRCQGRAGRAQGRRRDRLDQKKGVTGITQPGHVLRPRPPGPPPMRGAGETTARKRATEDGGEKRGTMIGHTGCGQKKPRTVSSSRRPLSA